MGIGKTARKPRQYHFIRAKWPVNQWFGLRSTGVERRYASAEAAVVISKVALEFPMRDPALVGQEEMTFAQNVVEVREG